MKILAIYPNADGYGRIPTGLAIIITVLKNAGHELSLFDTTFLHHSNQDNDTRERAGLVKKVETILGPDTAGAEGGVKSDCDGSQVLQYESLTEEQMNDLLLQMLMEKRSDAVIMTLVEDNYNHAARLLQVVKNFDPSIPIVVGGPTPSAAPDILIENPLIDYLIQGEGEEAVVELFDLLEKDQGIEDIRNLWYKKNGVVKHNPLRPFMNMDAVPIQDVALWDRRHFYKPYDGKLYWTGYFEMSRGCPYQCTYCVNPTIRKSLSAAGNFFRRKTPAVGLQEVKYHKEKYGLKRIIFCDDNFLMLSGPAFQKWAREFKEIWFNEINLPYWITTSADFIRPDTLQFLVETGCDGIGLGVEAGSEWFKRNILKRNLTNDQTVAAFKMIHDYGIRSTANIMMGFPGEYVEDVFESIKLMMRIQPTSFDLSLVAPYVGTDIHTVCVKLGLIDIWDKPGFKGMSKKISFRQFSTIRNPNMNEEQISKLYYEFMDYVSGKIPIPPEYLASAPGADNSAPARGTLSKEVADILKQIKLDEVAVGI